MSELPTLACKTRSGGQLNIERRNYENGFVLVNPNKEAGECALGESFYDVSVADWDHPPRRVDRVEIGARDAAFLINVVRN